MKKIRGQTASKFLQLLYILNVLLFFNVSCAKTKIANRKYVRLNSFLLSDRPEG